MTPDPTQAADRLRVLIQQSGRSASAYARDVLLREPRTVRRWLAGDSPIPAVVVAWIHRQREAAP